LPNYRGIHISQHNRYDLEYIIKLLSIIYKVAKDEFFEIPAGDYSNRTGKKDYCINDYPQYKEIVDKIKLLTGKGTYNSIKKNFFVDLEKMGLIYRTTDKKYARLTPDAVNLIKLYNNKEIRVLTKKFTDLIDEKLFGNYLSELVEFMWLYGYDKIDIYEYTFILNDVSITDTYKDILLRSYRSLTSFQKNKIIELIKKYANPNNFRGNKTKKRDFHNWINESQQIFSLLKFTTYFQIVEENKILKLFLNTSNETGIFSITEMKRNQSIRQQYFDIHNVPKLPYFELHHIVPIKIAVNKKDMKKIDNVLNLIYVHKNTHKQIHKDNLYRIKNIDFNNLELENIKNLKFKKLTNNEEIYFSREKKIFEKIKKYNEELIDEYKHNIYFIS